MAEIINLRSARKTRNRAQKRGQADQNAVRFGRTKALKALEKARADKARDLLDSHKREDREG
ncbi:hypothetical protein DEA8626_01829 [Defluviimonas aquaemixtae]|uniref:DUF4169 domain-containing protein n=1 Tax=Albidovulum aquaemixtae TaxID=1542388 RepID=A0A2R8B6U9_9RHOB|nr:DUF4169 family protein [Defluviimonas aquaemixtae]SPH18294.1 hypothetical protein DEA8626_01829 [Defluviimonas aquaemixtae]